MSQNISIEECEAQVAQFVEGCRKAGVRQIIVGIDPGVTGAIALTAVGSDLALVFDMPVVETSSVSSVKGKKKTTTRSTFQYAWIDKLFCSLLAGAFQSGSLPGLLLSVALERLQPMGRRGPGGSFMGDTAKTSFSMGVSYGMWPLYFHARNIRWLSFAPQTWKKALGLTSKDKNASRLLACQMFPRLADKMSRKSDHNRAEALLIAYHARKALTTEAGE